MRIREARAADSAAITAVNGAVWRTVYRGILPDEYLDALSFEECELECRRMLLDPASPVFFLVAEDKGKIVGFVFGGPNKSPHQPFQAEIYALYLLRDQRRRGVGRRLAQAAAAEFAARGLTSMIVWVLAENPFRDFYEHIGGAPLEERKTLMGGKELVEVAYGWNTLESLRIRPRSGSPRHIPVSPSPIFTR